MVLVRVTQEESEIERNMMMEGDFLVMHFEDEESGCKLRPLAATRSLKWQEKDSPLKPPGKKKKKEKTVL